MTISDALPIQFWPTDEETFNEKAVCGIIKQDCFCQPVNCDQIILIAIIDGSTTGNISLQILDENSNQIDVISFTRSGLNLTASFIPNDYSPCEQKLQLKVIGISVLQALASWTNQGSGSSWTLGSSPYIHISGVFASSKFLADTFNAISGNAYIFDYDVNLTDADGSQELTIHLLDSSFNSLGYYLVDVSAGIGVYTGTATITPSANASYLAVRLRINDDSGLESAMVHITSISYNGGNVTIFKSDCIEVKESHDCTKLISYSNASDFDGIPYLDITPNPTFYLRIPATFHEQENPQEQEDLELSNGVIVTLRQSIQEKTLLETGYMPNYMHKKLQKVLMHETIEIDGDNWKRRDPYETNPIKKYNLKRGSVLLTKYNSVLKNTI